MLELLLYLLNVILLSSIAKLPAILNQPQPSGVAFLPSNSPNQVSELNRLYENGHSFQAPGHSDLSSRENCVIFMCCSKLCCSYDRRSDNDPSWKYCKLHGSSLLEFPGVRSCNPIMSAFQRMLIIKMPLHICRMSSWGSQTAAIQHTQQITLILTFSSG